MEPEKQKKKHLSDGQLFLCCCVGGVVFFTWWSSCLCWNWLDQLIMVMSASGLMVLPFLFHKKKTM